MISDFWLTMHAKVITDTNCNQYDYRDLRPVKNHFLSLFAVAIKCQATAPADAQNAGHEQGLSGVHKFLLIAPEIKLAAQHLADIRASRKSFDRAF